MTSFQETPKTEEPKQEPEPIIVKSEPVSLVRSDPKLWEEALEFANMLTYCRPHGSKTERKFIAKYLLPLTMRFDKKGNVYKQIGDHPSVLWSCHTDTVHNTAGFQKIVYWPEKGSGDTCFSVGVESKKSNCLGADDTCGVWLMIQMIKANIPGLYIFHRAEEVGGLGSKWVAENNKEALNGIKFAIAFDRRGEKSIITYQRSKRCCSDDFANSLAEQLGMEHRCDTGGSFTDTASYVDLIPECTNVSAGYDAAHCATESTNVDYLFKLRDALLKLDVSKLIEKRKAGDNESLYKSYTYSGGSYHGGHSYGEWDGWEDRDWSLGRYVDGKWVLYEKTDRKKEEGLNGLQLRSKYKGKKGCAWLDDYEFDKDLGLWYPKKKKENTEDRIKPTYQDMIRMIRLNPEVVADILESCGYTPATLRDELLEIAGVGQTIHL